MLTLPINMAGRSTFLGHEAFGLEYSVRLRKPRFHGFEKLKIGLMDMESFKSLGAVSVGRLPLPLPSRDGDAPSTTNILERVCEPAIVLGRVEEPEVRGEIVLDYAELQQFAEIDTLEMLLRVGGEGQLSGIARIAARGEVREIELKPRKLEPREFYESRSNLPANARLAATLFVETIPRPQVQRVEPREVAVRDLGSEEKVRFRIEGFGFGPDTRVEILPHGTREEPISAVAIQRQRALRSPEGTVLLADIRLPVRAENYSLRVSTGGQRVVLKNALRVF
jgi:hypothetical protein